MYRSFDRTNERSCICSRRHEKPQVGVEIVSPRLSGTSKAAQDRESPIRHKAAERSSKRVQLSGLRGTPRQAMTAFELAPLAFVSMEASSLLSRTLIMRRL